MGTVGSFEALLAAHGSDAVYHRDNSTVPCPCLTPEGFRDPEWHDANPSEPMCNERGFLPGASVITVAIKAFVQPIISRTGARLTPEYVDQLFGEIQKDDQFGIFPEAWAGTSLDFYNWSQSGEDYITYNNRRYMVVNGNLIADPADGNPRHHWECGLRLISSEAL